MLSDEALVGFIVTVSRLDIYLAVYRSDFNDYTFGHPESSLHPSLTLMDVRRDQRARTLAPAALCIANRSNSGHNPKE